MYNLDELLDEVRENYYKSSVLKRPTISWSEDYITDYFGEYTFYNNHICISRILNSPEVSREMLSSVVYHESLHQDFQEHNSTFDNKAKLFPKYNELNKKLEEFSAKVHSEIEYKNGYNSFTKNKKRVVYIVLDKNDDYPSAFNFRNKSIIVDFNAKVTFTTEGNNDDFFLFLVKVNHNYHVVGWCINGFLYKNRQNIKHGKFDDDDYCFQLESDYDSTYVIPLTCCDYVIEESFLPKEIFDNNCCVFDINDNDIQPDIDYIESYCEGYYKIGFDLRTIECKSEFENIPIRDLKSISKTGYSNVWLSNAIYDKEPTYDNLVNRAVAKYQSWLLDSALEDFIEANQMVADDVSTVYDIIKIAVLLSKFDIAKQYTDKYKSQLPTDNKVLTRLYKEIEVHTL